MREQAAGHVYREVLQLPRGKGAVGKGGSTVVWEDGEAQSPHHDRADLTIADKLPGCS